MHGKTLEEIEGEGVKTEVLLNRIEEKLKSKEESFVRVMKRVEEILVETGMIQESL